MLRGRSPRMGNPRPPATWRSDDSDEICALHGWQRHVFTHEAAHALAAIQLAVPFEGIAVRPPNEWASRRHAGLVAGGLVMGGANSRDWIGDNVDGALRCVLAGPAGEASELLHCLPGTLSGDLQFFEKAALDHENAQAALALIQDPASLSALLEEMHDWAARNRLSITQIATALSKSTGPDGDGWSISESDIRTVLLGETASDRPT